ncbi:hypothetical protein B0H19DRAFT_1167235 [Mycena capillaripes]|nr:hypothetical protein B0H19DRAFT_1167235 [Mycena capillaripes]
MSQLLFGKFCSLESARHARLKFIHHTVAMSSASDPESRQNFKSGLGMSAPKSRQIGPRGKHV